MHSIAFVAAAGSGAPLQATIKLAPTSLYPDAITALPTRVADPDDVVLVPVTVSPTS